MIKEMKSDYIIRKLHDKRDEKKLIDEKKRYIVKNLPCKEIK